MSADVIMPALGMSQDTGKLLRWLKGPGETVARGESIAEIETDKATFELEAPCSGTLGRILAQDGDEVPVGDVVATVLNPGEIRTQSDRMPGEAGDRPGSPETSPKQPTQPAGRARTESERISASPKARRLARDLGISLTDIRGNGPAGAIVARDVQGYRAAPTPAAQPLSTRPQAASGAGMQATLSSVSRQFDATSLLRWSTNLQRRVGERLVHLDFYIRVVAEALGEMQGPRDPFRQTDVVFSSADADHLALYRMNSVDGLEVEEIAGRRASLLLRPPASASDLDDATIAIHDAGEHGVDSANTSFGMSATPVLSFGRVTEQVIAVNGDPSVRPTVEMTLTYHSDRVDPYWASRFVQASALLLEEPLSLLM